MTAVSFLLNSVLLTGLQGEKNAVTIHYKKLLVLYYQKYRIIENDSSDLKKL